jgi:hypothetical protein
VGHRSFSHAHGFISFSSITIAFFEDWAFYFFLAKKKNNQETTPTMCLCLCRVGQASSSTGWLLSCTCIHTEVRTWCRKDTDTRITRRGGVGAVKTAFAFSTHHCLFTFPPHQSAITAPFPSLLIRGQAREAEADWQSSSLHPRSVAGV